eukprot:scaffold42449_cov25-Tisochrysis_lutea.AAC.2
MTARRERCREEKRWRHGRRRTWRREREGHVRLLCVDAKLVKEAEEVRVVSEIAHLPGRAGRKSRRGAPIAALSLTMGLNPALPRP